MISICQIMAQCGIAEKAKRWLYKRFIVSFFQTVRNELDSILREEQENTPKQTDKLLEHQSPEFKIQIKKYLLIPG